MTEDIKKDSDASGAGEGTGSDEKNPAETLRWLEPTKLSFHWEGGLGPIRLTVQDDRSALNVHAARAFPLSHPDQLVQLFDGEKDGLVGMLEDVGGLAASDRRALEECLRRDRILPEVTRIVSIEEHRHLVLWVVETDRGVTSFDMDQVYKNVRRQPAGDVVLTDVAKNRYHLYPEALDAASREMLERYS